MTGEIAALLAALEAEGYIAEPATATALYLARATRKPLLIEGDAGVGKTELAKVLARMCGTELIRLQCYEGLDVQTALYEWDYPRQMLRLRLSEARGEDPDQVEEKIFSREYLLERPLLRAITHPAAPAVLLSDEIDRADDGFEAFLLEVLSDFQVTIPELGTITAQHRPHVVLTSNRTRELGTPCAAAASTSISTTRRWSARCASSARAVPRRRARCPRRSPASCKLCARAGWSSRPGSRRPWTSRAR